DRRVMTQYMLLFYRPEGERGGRWTDVPEWDALAAELRATGQLIAGNALRSTDAATTVRVRDGETDDIDGPFAVTKEMLGGYMLIEVDDIDEARRMAARVRVARLGSVEVRPLMGPADRLTRARE